MKSYFERNDEVLSNWYMTNTEKIDWIRPTAVNRLPISGIIEIYWAFLYIQNVDGQTEKTPPHFVFNLYILCIKVQYIYTYMWSVLYKLISTAFF
jgi:hypothetical protein